MNNNRLDITERHLNLEYVNKEDTLGVFIEKFNRNFREVANYGGGPVGHDGKMGRPGCVGRPGPPGKDGESELEWIGRIALSCDLTDNDELHDVNDVILNKYTNRTLLLSNLKEVSIEGSTILNIKDITQEELTALRISDDFNEYKLKIYDSDSDGVGHHIHLMNSKAAALNNNYLCRSGWTIRTDFDGTNVETLRIQGEENSNIINHTHLAEFTSDLLTLKRTQTSQELKFTAGSKTNSEFRSTFRLVDLTANQVESIPDRTGYLGVWQDTNEHSESWERVETTDVKITHSKYKLLDNTDIESAEDDTHYVEVDENSFIRFKRLNNWVLIDFHIGLLNNEVTDDFYLKNIQFRANKGTVGCMTEGWHPSTIMIDENYEPENLFDSLGFFKIDSTNYLDGSHNTFLISLRFLHNVNIPFSSSTIDNYWITGQVWATVQDPICPMITFDIEQGNVCPELDVEVTEEE